MKVCPVCSIDFFPNDPQRIYCSEKCRSEFKYTKRLKRYSPQVGYSTKEELFEELRTYGIRRRQIPEKTDAEFLSDLLWALKIITKR